MFKIENGRLSFYQWDINQRLVIEDPTITEVHFCNKTSDCALVCGVYEEDNKRLVNVPNILLQEDWVIYVFAYSGNHTRHEESFIVYSRTKPDSYIYNETEVKSFELLEKRIEALENGAGGSGGAVDLTGYATEEYVDNAISESAPDMDALSGSKSFINNRTHYRQRYWGASLGEAMPGITKLGELTTYQASFVTYEKLSNKYNSYMLHMKYTSYNKTNSNLVMNFNGDGAKYIKPIDTANIRWQFTSTTAYLYVITDLTALSDENKEKFPTLGVYVEYPEGIKWGVRDIEFTIYYITKKLDFNYMPAQFIEQADMEAYVDNAIALAIGGVENGTY